MQKLEIERCDNGWIVKTNYACAGGDKTKVYLTWAELLEAITHNIGKPWPAAIAAMQGEKGDL